MQVSNALALTNKFFFFIYMYMLTYTYMYMYMYAGIERADSQDLQPGFSFVEVN